MTRAARAYYGAATGALLSLLVHPVSRPYLTNLLSGWGPSHTPGMSGWIPANIGRLPTPQASNDLDTFALWALTGHEALRARQKLGRESVKNLELAYDLAAKADPNNGFWLQARAALLHASGRMTDAIGAWDKASRAPHWNDYQSRRLLRIREQIAVEVGASMSWQLRAVLGMRSPANVRVFSVLVRDLLGKLTRGTEVDRRTRSAAVRNAQIIRDGSRSIEIGLAAADLMDLAAYAPEVAVEPSIRRLLAARNQLIASLAEAGDQDGAREVSDAYRLSDNWIGLISGARAGEHLELLSLVSLLSATLPSTCLIISVVGAGFWWFGSLVQRSLRAQKLFQPPLAPALGISLAIAIYYLTQLPLASITAVLCFAFLVFTPARERSMPPRDLGFLFSLIVGVIALGVFLNLAVFLIGVSMPGEHLLPLIGVPREYTGGSTLFLGLTGIMLGLLLLTAPTWGASEKISTPRVVGMGFKALGSGLCATCLGLAVLLGPLAVYGDRQAGDVLQKIVENEPNYYLVQ